MTHWFVLHYHQLTKKKKNMTLCVFKVPYPCGERCGCCRKKAKKALKKAYGASIKFNFVEEKIIAEGDAVNQAEIIAVLQKEKIVKVSASTSGGGGGGGSNADGAKEANNGGERKDGGNMGLMVPPMGQYEPHPGYAMNQHYGYPQQPRPMDGYFSNENANGCTIM